MKIINPQIPETKQIPNTRTAECYTNHTIQSNCLKPHTHKEQFKRCPQPKDTLPKEITSDFPS